MTTHLQKALEESLKEFDKKFPEIHGRRLPKKLKSHLLSSQKKLISALIEDLKESAQKSRIANTILPRF